MLAAYLALLVEAFDAAVVEEGEMILGEPSQKRLAFEHFVGGQRGTGGLDLTERLGDFRLHLLPIGHSAAHLSGETIRSTSTCISDSGPTPSPGAAGISSTPPSARLRASIIGWMIR